MPSPIRVLVWKLAVVTALLTLPGLPGVAAALTPLVGGNVYPINGVQNPPASFSTLAAAAMYLAHDGVTGTGQVVLELVSGYPGESGPVDLRNFRDISATIGVTFRPGSGYTALTVATGSGAKPYAIQVGSPYVTLDGRAGGTGSSRAWTIRCTGSASNGRSAVQIEAGTNPFVGVAVRYCILEAQYTDFADAILFMNASSATSNITIENNLIRSNTTIRPSGIAVTGGSSSSTGIVIQNNVINQCSVYGIQMEGTFPGVKISGNEVFHTAPISAPAVSSEFAAIEFNSTASPGAEISGNFIHDIQLGASIEGISGIQIVHSNTTGAPARFFNNRIDLYQASSADVHYYGFHDLAILAGALVNVDDNSVYLGGPMSSGSSNSAAFFRESASTLNLRGNIFQNARANSGSATATHWAISATSTAGIAAINDNDYFADGSGGILGTTNGTTGGNKGTLALWKAAVPADLASISQDPHFLAPAATPPNLKLDPAIRTLLESGGLAISGIDADFEGDVRYGSAGYAGGGAAPDIGADEGEYTRVPVNDVAANSLAYPADGGEILQGTMFFPDAFFQNLGTADQVNVPVRFRITGPSPSTTEVYNGTGMLPSLPSNAILDGPFPAGVTLNTPGTYTMFARTELAGDSFAPNDEISGTMFVVTPLSGNYNVGAAETVPFNTLTNAIQRLNQLGASGPVTFSLVDPLYGPAESIPIQISAFTGASAVNTLTVRPAPGVATTITGSSATSVVLVFGAQYVILDGSNNGSGSRDLTITNTNAGSTTACVWVGSGGHNTVRNTILAGAGGTLVGAGFGASATPEVTGTGPATGFNAVQNCDIRSVQYGISMAGDFMMGAGAPGLVMADNVMTQTAPNQIRVCGILLRYAEAPQVTGNVIANVSNTAGPGLGISLGFSAGSPMLGATGAEVRNAIVARNRITGVASTSIAGYSAIGIGVAPASQGTNHLLNNMILGVTSPAAAGNLTAGIYVNRATALPSGDTEILGNSVAMSGSRGAATNPGFALAVGGANANTSAVTVIDNILYNAQTAAGGGKSYAVGLNFSSYGSWNSDYNVLYGSGAQSRYSVIGGLTNSPAGDRTALLSWQTETTDDFRSSAADPLFVNVATDLHISTAGPGLSPAANGGITVSGLTLDYDGDTRGPAPDIGADEFTTCTLQLAVAGAGSAGAAPVQSSYNPGSLVTLTATPAPNSYFAGWSGSASGTMNPLGVAMNADKVITANFAPYGGLSISDVSVTEGNAGPTPAVFRVAITPAPADTARVDYATVDGTAKVSDSDYVPIVSGTLTFLPGGPDTLSISVTVNGDTKPESNETFSVLLMNPYHAVMIDSTGAGTIVGDDPLPTLSVNDISLAEGNPPTLSTNTMFTVTISSPPADTTTVNYAIVPVTAADGFDYTTFPPTGVVTFLPAGPVTVNVPVTIFADRNYELNETFRIVLSAPINAALADSEGVGTIVNDDGPPTVSVQDRAQAEGNAGTTAFNFSVQLSALSYQTITVEFTTLDGSALVANGDYVPIASPVTLTFMPNTASASQGVTVNGDATVEPSESFTVRLANAVNAAILDGTGVGAILDDDGPAAVSIGDALVTEGNAGTVTATVPVMISMAVGTSGQVNYETSDGTATVAGNDYVPVLPGGGKITFQPMFSRLDYATVMVNGDVTNESDEDFFVMLTTSWVPRADSLGRCVVLNDDDTVPPTAHLTSPNGGETWAIGAPQNITWTASDNIGVASIDLDYSTNGGGTWSPVAAGLANSGTYVWTVPNASTTTARVRVAARDVAGNIAQDMSDANFTISAQGGADASGLPLSTDLYRIESAAANGPVTITYGLRENGFVELQVFDVSGRRIRELAGDVEAAGVHAVAWDGRTDSGGRAPSGHYFLRFAAGDVIRTGTVWIVR